MLTYGRVRERGGRRWFCGMPRDHVWRVSPLAARAARVAGPMPPTITLAHSRNAGSKPR